MTDGPAPRYEPIAVSSESTVVAEFIPDPAQESGYQSEAELERAFIELLREQAYEYLPLTSEGELIANLRTQLEALNGITFSDAEWERFFTERIAGDKDGIVEKTIRIQEDHIQLLQPRRRVDQEHRADRQDEHPQQPAAGHQPVRGRRHLRQPLRRHGARQRPADGAHRDQAARCRHPRGLQPDQPLPARQLLGGVRAVRVRAAVRHHERHADEVLQQHRPDAAPR